MWRIFLAIRWASLFTVWSLACNVPAREWREESFDTNYYLLQASVVDGATCEPMAGAEIVWIGGRGEEQVLATDSAGQLLSFLDYPWGWFSILYARQGERVSQIHTLYGVDTLLPELALGPPASLTGTIRKPNGAPLSDCTVRLSVPVKQPIHFMETRTDKSGAYRFDEVPPGTYSIRLDYDAYFTPFSSNFDRPSKASLLPGATTRLDINMEKRAIISGKVLAPDGSGARGVTFTVGSSNSAQPSTAVRTDDDGRFEVRVVPSASTTVRVGVNSNELGSGTLEIPPLNSGDSHENLVVQLGGAVQVRGTVRDPAGNPIPGVQIGGVTTDESGAYLVKGLALSSKGKITLRYYPPNPRSDSAWLSFDSTATTWYCETQLDLVASHGEELVRDVVLQPMEWRELRGQVFGPDGVPAADVEVLVYCGAPIARQWLDDRTPATPRWQEPYPPVPFSSGVEFEPATLVARCRTDKDGQWQASVLPEASNPESWLSDEKPDPDAFAVVASRAEDALAAVEYFGADGNSETPGKVELTLAPLPEDLITRLYLVDSAGLPIPGIRCVNPSTDEVHISDAYGGLALRRSFGIGHLNLTDAGYRILGARFEGELVSPAPPTLDPTASPKIGFGGHAELGPNPRTSGDSHLRWNVSRLYFVDFDDEKVRLVVTLARKGNQ